MTWEEFWNKVVNYFQSHVWNILWFAVVLIVGLLLIKVFLMLFKRIMRRKHVDEMAIRFVAAILRFVLLLVLVLILLSIIGISITGLTAALSAAVLAIGMALKEFLANVASGIILVGSNKYKTGDYIQVGDVDGMIIDINFLFTTLKTYDSTQVTLPNSTMVNSSVTNLGAYPIRRVTFTFSVAYESDTNLVRETLMKVMLSTGLVLTDPAPACHLKNLGESSIDFFCTCYCDNEDYWDVFYYVMEHGFEELKRAGIEIPFKQLVVAEKQSVDRMPVAYDALPKRQEKARAQTYKPLTTDDFEDLSFREIQERLMEDAKQNKIEREKEKNAAKARRKKKKENGDAK
ncbi:MAG: mechanosensitive ion channel [Bacilli bacterium]|nr:mechanosensitive ion channel [Bacilli bacterium]